MIDFNTYKQLHSDSHKFRMAYPFLTNPNRKEMETSLADRDEPPKGPELFVFPSTIVGYNLRQKKWRKWIFMSPAQSQKNDMLTS